MKTLILERQVALSDRTIGMITTKENKVIANTLERPWLANQVGVSCIPAGEYEVHRDVFGRHTWFSVRNVKGRTHIEMHQGSEPWHSQGCILIDTIGLQDILLETKGEPFKLIIKET